MVWTSGLELMYIVSDHCSIINRVLSDNDHNQWFGSDIHITYYQGTTHRSGPTFRSPHISGPFFVRFTPDLVHDT